MDYESVIKSYVKNGGDERKMWESVGVISEAMEYIKGVDLEKYECLMRKTIETLNGKHYSEEMAKSDVAKMYGTDADGVKHTGEYWTVEQIESATAGLTFPKGTTKWDKYVAYNATKMDFCKKFSDDQILDIAYTMWFDDEDWKSDGKIWDYMSMNS